MNKEKVRSMQAYKYIAPFWHFAVNIWRFPYWAIYRQICFVCNGVKNKYKLRKKNLSLYDISQFKNRHKGERCFIIATGPSLMVEDLEKLKNEVCIGVNGIYRIYKNTDWRPDYYALIDENIYKKIIKENPFFNLSDCSKEQSFVCDLARKVIVSEKEEHLTLVNVNVLDHRMVHEPHILKYSKDLSFGHYDALTVVNFAINLAQYMGFKEIYLLGTDCDYSQDKKYFDGQPSMYHKTQQDAIVSFHRLIKGYKFVQKKMIELGVDVYNATRGGALEVFPRVDLDEIIEENT